MTILTYPNDLLRQKSVAVDKVTDELRAFAKEMTEAMIQAEGLGISAPQVGRLIRAIVIMHDGRPLVMFNPVIIKYSTDKLRNLEGCLSFPGELLEIPRAREVHVKYRSLNNKMEYIVLSGMEARAVIHECEHLNGILLSDHGQLTRVDC